MSFTEINLFGVYVAPISLMIVAAWVITIALRRVAARFGLLRYVWHPALVDGPPRRALKVADAKRRNQSEARNHRRRWPECLGATARHSRDHQAADPDRSNPDHAGDGRDCRGARLGDVGGLYGRTLDARRHGARLYRDDGARGRRTDRRAAGRR